MHAVTIFMGVSSFLGDHRGTDLLCLADFDPLARNFNRAGFESSATRFAERHAKGRVGFVTLDELGATFKRWR